MINYRAEINFTGIKRNLNFQRIEDLKTFLKNLSILQCASISYIPLIGWIYPLVVNKENPTCQRHIKQGFIFALFFVFLTVILNLINIFTPVEWRNFRLGLVITIYCINFIYLLFCLIAIKLVLKGRAFSINIIKRLINLLEL